MDHWLVDNLSFFLVGALLGLLSVLAARFFILRFQQYQDSLEIFNQAEKEAIQASAREKAPGRKPDGFRPISGSLFDAQSWQPLGDERVLILTGNRPPETISHQSDSPLLTDALEVTVELHWRAYSVPLFASSDYEKFAYLGYFLYQGQRLKLTEEFTYILVTNGGEREEHYQARDLELFCFNYLIKKLMGEDWKISDESLQMLQLIWEPNRQAWILSTSSNRIGEVYNTSIWSSHKASILFDFQNLIAHYKAEYNLDCSD